MISLKSKLAEFLNKQAEFLNQRSGYFAVFNNMDPQVFYQMDFIKDLVNVVLLQNINTSTNWKIFRPTMSQNIDVSNDIWNGKGFVDGKK